MQAPEDTVETTRHYRVAYALRITATSKEQAEETYISYLCGGDAYPGGVQGEIGYETVELDWQWEPIPEDSHLEAQYEDQVNGGGDES